jgi:hypothetical protein
MGSAESVPLGRNEPNNGPKPDNAKAPADVYARWLAIANRLVQMPDDKLAALDTAELNLGAAFALPGAQDLDVGACLEKLRRWTELVRVNTEHWWPRFVRSPGEFDNSPGQFRMLTLVTILQRDLGVRYNLAFLDGDYNGSDSRNLFIHGLLSGHGGTCVSMPVLYIVVGRRLGYPLRLVRAKEHLFARWEEPGGERFNIESTSRGFSVRDDEFYRKWPKPITDAEVDQGFYLRSLRPREELAEFLRNRGNCLRDNMAFLEAARAYSYAAALTPDDMTVQMDWAATTALDLAIQNAQERARAEGRSQIELRNLAIPALPNGWNVIVPFVHEEMERIAKIHLENTRRRARVDAFAAIKGSNKSDAESTDMLSKEENDVRANDRTLP